MKYYIEILIQTIELIGVVTILGGIIRAICLAFKTGFNSPLAYDIFKKMLGRSILLGLELLVAADIINTVAVDTSIESVSLLGCIVLIRTFLSFSLDVELEGKWPWQKDTKD